MSTPCEDKGYQVGDFFLVTGDDAFCYEPGTILRLYRDDGSDEPEFSFVEGEFSEGFIRDTEGTFFIRLSEVKKLETKEKAKTPCGTKGYQVGDIFEFITEDHHVCEREDLVELEEDDGTTSPYFKVLTGKHKGVITAATLNSLRKIGDLP